MSFLLDPAILLLIGLLAGKVNYLTMIFGDRFFTRGKGFKFLPTGYELFLESGWNLFVVGVIVNFIFLSYSSLLYIDLIYFPWPLPKLFEGSDWMLNSGLPLGLQRTPATDVAAVIIFTSYPFWYWLGTRMGLAGMKIREQQMLIERDRIMREVLRTAIPKGGIIPLGADDVDAIGSVKKYLEKVPYISSTAITILLFVFDSHFIVFALTGKWKRFVDLDDDNKASTREKRKYMEAWESIPQFLSIFQVLKLVSCFGFYTNKEVWKYIDYEGPYPVEPPWYNQGSSHGILPNKQTRELGHDN